MAETRLEKLYQEKVVPALMSRFGFTNVNQVPRIKSVVLNMGVGEAARDAKILEALRTNMGQIAGQRPVVTAARVSVANFKVRQGMPVGISVTLRRERMYSFLDRLISLAIPRIRDFRGLNPKSFDGRGNFAMGLQEQLVWPEIDYDSIPRVQGMDIVITTSASDDEQGRELMRLMGMPFRS